MSFKLQYGLPSLAKTQSDDWVRPADWPVITDTPLDVQALVNDQGAGYIAFTPTFTGSAYIDWGDGVTQSLVNNAPIIHYYTPGTGTTCSRGYTTFKVRATPTAGGQITAFRPANITATASNGTYLGTRYSIGILEMYYGDTTQTTTSFSSYFSSNAGVSSAYTFNQLEYVKFPATASNTNFSNTFQNCPNLQKVLLPNCPTSAAGSMVNAFNGCQNLKSIEIPEYFPISNLQNAFASCYSLKSVTFRRASTSQLASCTSLQNAFNACTNLVSIDLPSTPSVTDFLSSFQSCYNLRYFRLQGAPTFGISTNLVMTNMFQYCYSLEQAIFANPVNVYISGDNMFNNCYSLKNLVLPSGFRFSTMLTTFSGCQFLQRIELQATSMPLLTSMNQTFLNCGSLVSLTLPASGSSGVTGVSTFQNCASLASLSSTIAFLSTNLMFSGCSNLKSVSLPNIGATTNCASMFASCFNLVDVSIPSTLTACINFSAMFNGCVSLKSFAFPTVTTTGTGGSVPAFNNTFNNCSSLRSATFSSFAAYNLTNSSTTFSGMFNNCYSLESVDMSAFSTLVITPNASTDLTGGTMFNNCSSLKTVKFGSFVIANNNVTSNTNIATSFTNCQSLVNLDTSSLYNTNLGFVTWQVVGTTTTVAPAIQGLTFSCKFSRFLHNGTTTVKYNLQGLRILNTLGGQYAGVSPQIDVSYTMMGQAALVQLFNDLPTLVSKTINITGCPGASLLTAGERAIATGKGWTITG